MYYRVTNTQRLSTLIENIAKKGNVLVDVVAKNMVEEVPMKRFAEASEIACCCCFSCFSGRIVCKWSKYTG